MQEARGQREALLPAARQGAGELSGPVSESKMIQRALPPRLAIVESVHAGDEGEVLANREVFPEREPLGHVADAPFDGTRLAHDVVAEAMPLAAVRRQQ